MIRVLYAEDDPQVADMVRLYFGQHGGVCTLDHVDCGRRCLEAMQTGGYDVLLLDLMMPDLDGLQVLGELTARRDPTPIIMVSGQGQHELAVRALRAGAADCIDKNTADFGRLPEIVQRLHARHQRRRAAAVAPTRGHRVLFIDPEESERAAVAHFFSASTLRLRLSAEPLDTLEQFLRGELEQFLLGPGAFDAVVLGPNL
ncbi:MAG: response regulator, partial [Opitutaceae bacterium]